MCSSFTSAPSDGLSLVGGELEEASGLALILLQAAKTLGVLRNQRLSATPSNVGILLSQEEKR